MTEDAPIQGPLQAPAKSPEPRAQTDTASRVQVALKLGGLVIALVNGAALPLLSLPPSLPALALAGTMMGVGQAVKITRGRRGDGDGS